MFELKTRKIASIGIAAAIALPATLMAGCQQNQQQPSNTANETENAIVNKESSSSKTFEFSNTISNPAASSKTGNTELTVPNDNPDGQAKPTNTSNELRELAAAPQILAYHDAEIELDVDTLAMMLAKTPDLSIDMDYFDEGEDVVNGRSVLDVDLVSKQFPDVEIAILLYNESNEPLNISNCKVGGIWVSYIDEQKIPELVLPGGFSLSMRGSDARRIYGKPTDMSVGFAWLEEDEKDVEWKNDTELFYGDEFDTSATVPAIMLDFYYGEDKRCQEISYSTAKYNAMLNEELERDEAEWYDDFDEDSERPAFKNREQSSNNDRQS